MKQYNINEYIYIHITERGWEYLNNIWGSDHVKKYIEPYNKVINGKVYHQMQCHVAFNDLPTRENGKGVLFEPTIFIDDSNLKEV